ncbi:Alcohol dehydrogenase superfamily protein [Mycena venus]|uniref:Alcohol dehydrogenase superfamily protein n=1 Tax=Mycena venus TaxID=2733690 RepID=A0A8H6YCT1_9AGAR|nr:Alcohol dehydrogenase superfamily protein [Mycena venus]
MSFPETTRYYYFPQVGEYSYLAQTSSPLQPLKSDEVLVKIHAVSLQARDQSIALGHFPSCPNIIPCSDMAGEVVAIGAGVVTWKHGDRVCANLMLDHITGDTTPAMLLNALGGSVDGVLTQYRAFPAHSLVKAPAHFSYEESSTLPCAALTAFNALEGVKAGDTVLISGTGGVATFALQFASAMSATVIVTSSSDTKLEQAKTMGATHAVNYTATPAWDEEVLKLTVRHLTKSHFQLVGAETLVRSMNVTRMGGTIAIIGVRPTTQTSFPDIVLPSIMKGFRWRGIQVGSVELFRKMIAFIETHRDATRPVVGKVFAFAEAREAYEYLASHGHVGKVVIRVD